MKNIIFIAPPGAGKGTQSELLVKKYGYTHISIGELLRIEVAKDNELSKEIQYLMNNGILVSDDIVTELIKNKIIETEGNFILDGYPRSIKQADRLFELGKELNVVFDTVIYLDMDETVSMQRALGRITCPKCKRGYNKYFDEVIPKLEYICDECNVPLEGREDDTEESFKLRLKTYMESTEPLLKYYKDLGILYMIDNSGTPQSTFEKIEEVI